MKRMNFGQSVKSLFDLLHRVEPQPSALTIKVENDWAEGKRPSELEACLAGGVSIDQVIRPSSCEVMPRSRNAVLQRNDVLLMHADQTAQNRIEAFIGHCLDT